MINPQSWKNSLKVHHEVSRPVFSGQDDPFLITGWRCLDSLRPTVELIKAGKIEVYPEYPVEFHI